MKFVQWRGRFPAGRGELPENVIGHVARQVGVGESELVEGALARLVRGLVDHGSRHAWARSTGEWPGEEQPDAV